MSAKEQRKIFTQPLFIIFALLTIVGLVCWFLQLTKGLQLTHLNNYNTWGLYIIGFMIFTGIAAGSLIFASSAYLFPAMAEYKPYTRIAAFVGAIGSVVAAGLFIIVDIGNPERAWHIITSANIASPMFWDTVILGTYVILGIFFTRQLMAVHAGRKEEKSLKGIAVVSFIAGLFVMVTSFVFALQVARPLWNNPAEPVSFLAAALVAALALLIIIFTVLNKSGYIDISQEKLSKLGKLAAVFLFFELFIVLGEAAIGLYVGSGEEAEIIHWLVKGEGAPFFWVELIAIVAGLVLLLSKKPGVLAAGSAVSIFAIFMIKYNLLQAQLLNPLITYAGPPGYGGGEGVYLPSLVELGVAVGIISLGALLVIIGLDKLNLGLRSGKGAGRAADSFSGKAGQA
ncbi:polysulfide reductase [Desulfitobacterium dehalogenans ATCC 51507]|uniref:Polysulfide reductase n=1 Tax=Desulfitobacterium dehalogenans (strain ATCC 51507 / DSM 9161 / JW/IU-DC1) TaxID=756499 RepID=I4A8U8_DESDJ|nr:NrfD/PsrC family molybdoenzyme membrane anchor subunit [Desulfitobacterium dehalogenans]AFM00383.1 polysulfide reductase [Desulfitobacterium dehalogenans ATCC 51507]